MNCGTCRWWTPDPILGQCRRFPQIVTKHHSDWCGEFRPSGMPPMTPDAPPPEAPKRRGRPPKTKTEAA